jgi:hypothetical protein
MDRIAYEEACKVWHVSGEELRKAAINGKQGLNDLMAAKTKELLAVGWTSDEILKESSTRMREKIFTLQKQESSARKKSK